MDDIERKEKMADKAKNEEIKVIEITGRYDPSAAAQIANLPVPDDTIIVLDKIEVGTVGQVREWVKEYESVISKNPLRKRKGKEKSREWLKIS